MRKNKTKENLNLGTPICILAVSDVETAISNFFASRRVFALPFLYQKVMIQRAPILLLAGKSFLAVLLFSQSMATSLVLSRPWVPCDSATVHPGPPGFSRPLCPTAKPWAISTALHTGGGELARAARRLEISVTALLNHDVVRSPWCCLLSAFQTRRQARRMSLRSASPSPSRKSSLLFQGWVVQRRESCLRILTPSPPSPPTSPRDQGIVLVP